MDNVKVNKNKESKKNGTNVHELVSTERKIRLQSRELY